MELFFSRYLDARVSCSWQGAEFVSATSMFFLLFFPSEEALTLLDDLNQSCPLASFHLALKILQWLLSWRGKELWLCFHFTLVVHFSTLMSAVCEWAGHRIAVLPSKPGLSSFVSIVSSGSVIRKGCTLCLCVRCWGGTKSVIPVHRYIAAFGLGQRDLRTVARESRALCPVRPLQLRLFLLCSCLRKIGYCAGQQSLGSQNRPKFCYCSHDKCSTNQPLSF